jgi:hypothetical protein
MASKSSIRKSFQLRCGYCTDSITASAIEKSSASLPHSGTYRSATEGSRPFGTNKEKIKTTWRCSKDCLKARGIGWGHIGLCLNLATIKQFQRAAGL